VREQAAISLRSRDAGNQYWGRIAGMPSGTETQNWVKDKFKAMGVPYETVTVPASADYPKSWGIDVSSNGKSLHLKSAFPLIDFPETAGSLKGDHELDTVWVSLGQESDFLGKDVRGKAVFIYSIPTPSVLIQSSMWMESVGRAQKAGAAAIIVDVAIPGNMQYVSHLNGGRVRDIKVPVFTLGDEDGRAVEQMNAGGQGCRSQDPRALGCGRVPRSQAGHRHRQAAGHDGRKHRHGCHTRTASSKALPTMLRALLRCSAPPSILRKCRRKNAAEPCTSSRCSIITAAIAARNGCTTIFNRYSRRRP
jgi:hypothetical protein